MELDYKVSYIKPKNQANEANSAVEMWKTNQNCG